MTSQKRPPFFLSRAKRSIKSNQINQVKRILVEKRENVIVNRLNKTKTEKFPDLRQEKENRLRELRRQDQAAQQQRVKFIFYYYCYCTPTRSKRKMLRQVFSNSDYYYYRKKKKLE